MSKRAGLITLGILSILVGISGFPEFWKELFFVAAGAIVAAIGFFIQDPVKNFTDSTKN